MSFGKMENDYIGTLRHLRNVRTFHPKALQSGLWQVSWLTRILPPSHSPCRTMASLANPFTLFRAGLTVAGTATDFHGIPY
jgi:hypothetical protein